MKKIMILFIAANMVFGTTMTLSDCIQTAEKNNLDIRISEMDQKISGHSLIDARNRFYDVTGRGSYFFNADDDDNQNTSLSASIGLTGQVSPSLFHNYQYSKISNESTDINDSDIINSIRYTIINSFFQVLIAEEKLNLQTDIAEYSQKKYEEAELKYSMGNISKSDLLSFEVSKSSDIIDLKAAESSLKKSKQTLVYYMNAKIIADSLKISYEQQAITEDNFVENDLIEEAFSNRPDLTIQKYYLRQKELSLKMEYDNYLPSLSGSIGYDYNKYDDLNNDLASYSNDGIKASIGLSLNMTYSGLNGIDRSKVEIKKSQLQLDSKIESVKNEIKLKLIELDNQKNNLILASKHVELAQENLDLADKLFFIGDKSATDYLQARNDYISARYRKINSQYNFILSKYDLFNSLGRKP